MGVWQPSTQAFSFHSLDLARHVMASRNESPIGWFFGASFVLNQIILFLFSYSIYVLLSSEEIFIVYWVI